MPMLPRTPAGNERIVPPPDEMLERWNAFVRETDACREGLGAVEPADAPADPGSADELVDGEPTP